MRWIRHGLLVLLLTVLTQLGGLAWLAALPFRRRWLAFTLLYAALSVAAVFVAPMTGRVALPCLPGGALQSQSVLFCALNRNYVTPELAQVARDTATEMARRHPGTVTLTLDAGFPFVTGFPLLPHLSHADGRKLDLAFAYTDEDGAYLTGKTRSPIGYWAFEQGPTTCPQNRLTMRWDLGWLQGLFPDRPMEPARTAELVRVLLDDARVTRVFLEPHLQTRLDLEHPKLRFQGCRAARHDDHIHIEI